MNIKWRSEKDTCESKGSNEEKENRHARGIGLKYREGLHACQVMDVNCREGQLACGRIGFEGRERKKLSAR